jgi:hypothetical protein
MSAQQPPDAARTDGVSLSEYVLGRTAHELFDQGNQERGAGALGVVDPDVVSLTLM